MIHHYKLNGYNIVLDVASGSVHRVDDVAYDAISMYQENSSDEIAKHLMSKYDDVTLKDALLLMAKIEELKEEGKLFSDDVHMKAAFNARDLPIRALCLNVSHSCNMSCAYCFISDTVSSHDESGGSDVSHEPRLMSPEIGKAAIDFLIMNSKEQKFLDVDFFGGEPLLNWGVVKEVVAYARELEPICGKKFRFTLTTNGLNIDEDVIRFTNREMHNVVLSLDGREEVHDAMRKLPSDSGSYNEVLPKIKELVKERRGKGYYIRGTYTNKNLDFVHDILHIADLGFKEISLEPVIAKPGASHGLTMNDLPKLKDQYESLALEMLKRRDQLRGFNFYHYMIDLTDGPCLHKRIAGCGVGVEYLAVTPDGELYPCHQFIGIKKFLMGDVVSGLIDKKIRDEFADCDIYSRAECAKCWARYYCSGGCAANAYNAVGTIRGIYNLECELFKKRIECAIMMKAAE